MIDRCHVGKKTLCRSQINSKIARVSQTVDPKGRWLAEEVTVKTVSIVLLLFTMMHLATVIF